MLDSIIYIPSVIMNGLRINEIKEFVKKLIIQDDVEQDVGDHAAEVLNPIQDIPFFHKIKFYIISIFWGLFLLIKLFGLWMWNSQKYFMTKRRNKPPSCLVDSSYGQHSYIKLKGAKLHYVESGSIEKPIVILIHGFLDCWIGWRHQIAELSQHFRVIALDLRGFGDSEKPPSRLKYKTEELVHELADFITTIGGGNSCIVIGHDLGALLSWFLIYTYPKLIKKFISISCPHPNVYWNDVSNTSLFNLRFMYECQLPWIIETRMMQQDIKILDKYLNHLPAISSSKGVISREIYKYVFSRRVDWKGSINYYRCIWKSRLKVDNTTTSVPILLLIGDNDNSCSLEASIRSLEYNDKITVRIIDNTGHFPHQQAPIAVNRYILNFLDVPGSRNSPQPQNKGLVNRMFGALSSTVQYGNQMLETVQKFPNRSPSPEL